jgi:protein-disulfide isomerase
MVGSTFWVLRGGYNFYVYGSCNGLNESGFCAFDPSGENNKTTALGGENTCGITQKSIDDLTLGNTDLSIFPIKNKESKDTVVFIGCYACDYSRSAYPNIRKLVEKKNTNFIFAHYPAKGDTMFLGYAGYAVREIYGEEAFWEFNDYLFDTEKEYVLEKKNLDTILIDLGFDPKKINEYINRKETKEKIEMEISELNKTNIYGTPTIFINDEVFVGPKPYRVYKSAINKFIFF